MKETAKYCDQCIVKLSPTETEPKRKEFFDAELAVSREGNTPDFQVQVKQGTCENCGTRSDVKYYCI